MNCSTFPEPTLWSAVISPGDKGISRQLLPLPPFQKIISRAKLHSENIVSFWHLRKITCVGTVCACTQKRENSNLCQTHSHAIANQKLSRMANIIPADDSEEVLLEENHQVQLNPVSGTAASRMRTEGGRQRPTSRGRGHSSDGVGDTLSTRPNMSL